MCLKLVDELAVTEKVLFSELLNEIFDFAFS